MNALLERLVTHFWSMCVQLAILSDPRPIFEAMLGDFRVEKYCFLVFRGGIFVSRVAVSQYRSTAVSLYCCIAVSLYRSITVSLYRCSVVPAASLCRCIAVSLHRSIAVSQYRCIAVSQYRSIAVSQYRCVAVSQCRSIVVSLYRCICEVPKGLPSESRDVSIAVGDILEFFAL